MAQGSTLQAACDAVGVDRRTGRHWRQATGGRIPRKKPDPSGRYLSLEERLRIADLHLAGTGVRAIAAQLGRPASTISRELARNGPQPNGRGRAKYAPYAAQKRAELRGRRPKASKFEHAELAAVVQAKLCTKWSPEQISDYLATKFPDRAEMQAPKRFTRRCTFRAAATCALTCTNTCAPAGPCAAPDAPQPPRAPARSRT
jgi:transposase